MNRDVVIRIVVSVLLILAYLLVAGLDFHPEVFAPIIVLGICVILFLPARLLGRTESSPASSLKQQATSEKSDGQ